MRSQIPMAAIRVPPASPQSTRSGEVSRLRSRISPAIAPATIGITMIAVTWPRILTSPIGVSCAIRVRLTAVGRREYSRGPFQARLGPRSKDVGRRRRQADAPGLGVCEPELMQIIAAAERTIDAPAAH